MTFFGGSNELTLTIYPVIIQMFKQNGPEREFVFVIHELKTNIYRTGKLARFLFIISLFLLTVTPFPG